jgi:tetratricopeptide (TPR) repeat protein
MRILNTIVTTSALGAATVGALAAQQAHQHEDEQVGRVHFPASCRADTQDRFERAVALLHSFWYEKAADAFQEVLAADSTCAMGYWGQAMAILHPLWTPPSPTDLEAGLAAAERGLTLAKTPRERDYLAAIHAYYAEYASRSPKTRLAAYAAAMEGVQRRNPGDHEAAIFYALALIAVGQANPTDTTFANQKRADSILEPLFKADPEHPGLAHYLIHTNDVPELAQLGLYAARRYAGIAPDVPHAQHMPSHIFTRLGLWDEDIASNVRSAEAARRFEEERHLNALWDQHGHAWDYLVYAYLQTGRDGAAKRILDEAAGVTAVYPTGSLTNAYALAAIPARYALERGRWGEATRLAVRPAPEWRAAEAITHFARALGAARGGDTAVAREEIAMLGEIEQALAAAGDPQAYWSGQVKIQRLAATAWVALASGDTASAVRQAAAAADLEDVTQKHPVTPGAVLPARELLGDLLLALNRPTEAARAYEQALRQTPGRARSIFGLGKAAQEAGDSATAQTAYKQYLELLAHGDSDRPEIAIARSALASR